jgi:hypothetical protein
MTGVEQPIYLVARGDRWARFPAAEPLNAAHAFGTEDDARRYVKRIARKMDLPPSAFRVVRYDFSGEVKEG